MGRTAASLGRREEGIFAHFLSREPEDQGGMWVASCHEIEL